MTVAGLLFVQRQLGEHAHSAAGLAAAFGGTVWWVVAFVGVTLIPVLFLPGRVGAH